MFDDFTNPARLSAQRMSPHHAKQRFLGIWRHACEEFAFVGDVKRVQSQDLAGPCHIVADRKRFLEQSNACSRL